MPAQYENRRRFDAPLPSVLVAIDGALRDIGAKAIEWSADRQSITAKLSFNWWSWGERLTVIVDDSGQVQVRSICSFPPQIIDWGKNAENCRKFLDRVANRLGSGGSV